MSKIRSLVLPALACLLLAGCNTSSSDTGGVMSSLGVPSLDRRDCPKLAAEAGRISSKALVALGLPAREVRDGPDGTSVVAWPDPQSLGMDHEETAREMWAFRKETADSGCPLTFDANVGHEPAPVAPVPTLPVETSAELPAPVEVPPPVAVVAAVPRAPPTDISIPIARGSAWNDDPLPVGVVALNPGLPSSRQEVPRAVAPAAPVVVATLPKGSPPAGKPSARGASKAAKAEVAPVPPAAPKKAVRAKPVETAPAPKP